MAGIPRPFVQAKLLSPSPPVSLVEVAWLTATSQIRLTFSRPVVAGSVTTNTYRVTGANAVVRNVQGGAFATGTVVTRAASGVSAPTAPATSTFTGGTTPFVDSDGNRVPVWSGRPVVFV